MTTTGLLVEMATVAWYVATVVFVGGAIIVWAQRNRSCRQAFYAGVAEGKAIERLRIVDAMSSDTTLDDWLESVLIASTERREEGCDGGA